ncbi:MAG: DNA mismatch repair protein MutS, partial [Deltaproteobacteria bacterium]|nr:DNA mismatch repair protein MutS [Deltaproteobacteria bacterium]
GAASRSYGIHVARLAGLPEPVLARAREILANLESHELDESGRPTIAVHPGGPARKQQRPQLGLFESAPAPQTAPATPVVAVDPKAEALATAVRALQLDRMTPLEALMFLHEQKKKL